MDDEHQTVKKCGGVGIWLHALLTSALGGCERPLYYRGKSPAPLLNKGLAGPQSRSGCHGENKSLPQSGVELWHIYMFHRRVLSHHLQRINKTLG